VLETLRELGYELVPIELPEEPEIRFILNVEAAAAFEALTRSNKDDELTRQIVNAWPNAFRTAHFVPAVAYVQASRLRRQLMEDVDKVLTEANVDVYVNPSWHSNSLFITNMTGHPSITVPNGMNEEGTPRASPLRENCLESRRWWILRLLTRRLRSGTISTLPVTKLKSRCVAAAVTVRGAAFTHLAI